LGNLALFCIEVSFEFIDLVSLYSDFLAFLFIKILISSLEVFGKFPFVLLKHSNSGLILLHPLVTAQLKAVL